jgi:MarR family transcriptional regulator for hemolysin
LTVFIMSDANQYRLHQSLGYQLSVAARLQERRLEVGLRDLGLTRLAWCVLLAVGNECKLHPSEIADFIGVDRTATSRVLRKMELDQIIARAPDTSRGRSADGRMTSVHLTQKGHQLLQRGTPFARNNNAVLEQNLSEREKSELRGLLAKLSAPENVALSRL